MAKFLSRKVTQCCKYFPTKNFIDKSKFYLSIKIRLYKNIELKQINHKNRKKWIKIKIYILIGHVYFFVFFVFLIYQRFYQITYIHKGKAKFL